jgi:hypothetical protein
MNQQHLVPQVVIDCAEKLLDDRTNENVKQNYQQRIEATKRFCETVLEQMKNKKRR